MLETAKLLLLGVAATVVCAPGAMAQNADRPNNYAAFVTALSALAVSNQDAIQNERNVARLEFVRQQVTKKLLAAFPSDPARAPVSDPDNTLSLAGVLDETLLLCGFRSDKKEIVPNISSRDTSASVSVDHLNTLAQQNYLTAVAGQLQALAAPTKTNDILSAFKSIFATYRVAVSAQPIVSDADRARIRKSCEVDLRELDAVYFGERISEPRIAAAQATIPAVGQELLGMLGPFGSLASTVIGIAEPVLEDFADLLSDFQKKQAVKAFVSDQQNQSKLREAGIGLGRTGSDYLFAKRLSLAGAFAEQIADLTGSSLDLKSKELQQACPTPSAEMYRRGADGLPTAQFRRCYRAIWSHFEDRVTAALKTASAYDQIADAGDTSTQLNGYKALTTDFSKIVDESGQVDLWDTVSKMLTFASAVKTASSEDSLKKLEQALDALSNGK